MSTKVKIKMPRKRKRNSNIKKTSKLIQQKELGKLTMV